MELEVNVLYFIALDVGQCLERTINRFISDFESNLGSNDKECLTTLGDIEACIEILECIEKGFLVSAVVLHKHEYDFNINNLKKTALELNKKLKIPVYVVHKDYKMNICALYATFSVLRKNIYGEENIRIYFNSIINAFSNKNK